MKIPRVIQSVLVGTLLAGNALAIKAIVKPAEAEAHWWWKVHGCEIPGLEGSECLHSQWGGCDHDTPC